MTIKKRKIKITAEQRAKILASAGPDSGMTSEAVNTLSDVLESSMNVQLNKISVAARQSAELKAEQKWKAKARAAVHKVRSEMAKKLDMYLDHVVTKWTNENRVVLKRTVEDVRNAKLLGTVMKVFEHMNFTVPTGKRNAVEALQAALNEQKALAASRQDKINAMVKEQREREQARIVKIAMKGLTESQKERVIEHAVSLKFKDMAGWKLRVEGIVAGVVGGGKPSNKMISENRTTLKQTGSDPIAAAVAMFSK